VQSRHICLTDMVRKVRTRPSMEMDGSRVAGNTRLEQSKGCEQRRCALRKASTCFGLWPKQVSHCSNAVGETAKFLPACKAVSSAVYRARSAARGCWQQQSQINDCTGLIIESGQNSAYRHKRQNEKSPAKAGLSRCVLQF
jgi:hypothetical protein